MAKQPAERLIPTFEVVVADPEMVRPESVVVPKPFPATDKNLTEFEDDATSKTGLVWLSVPWTASFAYGEVVPTPRLPDPRSVMISLTPETKPNLVIAFPLSLPVIKATLDPAS